MRVLNIYTYKGKINLVEFYFVEKGGSTGKRGVQTTSVCGILNKNTS